MREQSRKNESKILLSKKLEQDYEGNSIKAEYVCVSVLTSSHAPPVDLQLQGRSANVFCASA